MNEAQALSDLIDIVSGIFGRRARNLTAATTAADVPGWDSMQMINIIMTVQEKYDIELENDELDRIRCLGDFAKVIANKVLSSTDLN